MNHTFHKDDLQIHIHLQRIMCKMCHITENPELSNVPRKHPQKVRVCDKSASSD